MWSSRHLFCLLALFSVIRGLAIASLPRMFDLWCSCRTVCIETRWSRWMLSSAATFAAVVRWFLDTILFDVRRSLSLSFGFRTLLLLADDVFPYFVYAVITLETAALYTPNEVAVLVTDAPAKRALTICPLWKSYKLLFCSTFILTVDKTQLVMHWRWHCTP